MPLKHIPQPKLRLQKTFIIQALSRAGQERGESFSVGLSKTGVQLCSVSQEGYLGDWQISSSESRKRSWEAEVRFRVLLQIPMELEY